MSRKLFGICLFCILVIFLLLATSVFALDWQLIDDGNPAPRGRYGMTYDTFKEKGILFGGDVGLLNIATDTWEYDGSNWVKKITSSQPTDINASDAIQGMVYDTVRKRVVLLLSKFSLETWEYDGTDWTQIITQHSPPNSINGIAYDRSRQKTVLYQSRPNSTWEYDGADWTEVQTTNNPGERSGYKMVFDSTRNRVLLFGGWLFTGNFASDLWAYDGNNWTPVAAQNTPPPRGALGLAYNESNAKLILYGGYQSCGYYPCYLRDTWEFDGTEWSEVATTNAPSARQESEMIYDAQRNRTILFGGLRYENWGVDCETQIYFDDTWEFDGTNWIEIETKSSPPARMGTGVTYDSERNATLMFGGKNIDMGCPLNDTWAYNGTWQEIQLNNPLPPIVNPLLTYDSNRKRAIMVGMGRYEPGGHCCEDDFVEGKTTWEFDGTEWLMVNTPTPAPNIHGTPICFDSVRNKVVAMTSTYPGNNIEVWEYDGTDWTQAVTPHLPTPRRFFSFAFDKVRGKTVLFGGEDPSTNPYTYLHDTWEYDGTDWTQVETAYTPETAVQALMTFDSSREMIILYGGYGLGQSFHDTWAYNGSNWQKIETSVSPLIVDGTQIVFDENRTRTVLFGGIDTFSAVSGETWELYEKPAFQWAMTFGGNGNDWLSSVQETMDGGYIAAGYTTSFGTNGDMWLLKINPDGTVDWSKTYGGTGYEYAFSIQQTIDDGYIVAGQTSSFGAGQYDFWILKLNLDGTVAWQKTYGGTGNDSAYSIQQTTDGGYIIAGETVSFGAGDFDVWLLKLNPDGTVVWQKTYGKSAGDQPYYIHQTADGGYILTGRADTVSDVWIIKLNSTGNIEWQKRYDGWGYDSSSTIKQTFDQEGNPEGYIILGTTSYYTAGNEDLWILKLNIDGTIAWQKAYGGTSSDYGRSIQQTPDGGYILAGETKSFGAGLTDIWVLKLNPDGSVAWQKRYGGSSWDFAKSIKQTEDGGYIVGAWTMSFGMSGDFLVLKLNANGEIPACSYMYNTQAIVTDTTTVIAETTVVPQNSSAIPADTNVTPQNTLAERQVVCTTDLPTIGYSPTNFSFTATQGGSNPSNQNLSIWNCGGGTLNWSVSDNATWLSLNPTSGTDSGTVTVSVNIAGLTAGTYNAIITITASGATNSPINIPVSLTINAPPPTIGYSPTNFSFTATQGGSNPSNQSLNILNAGGGTLSWSVSDDANWLSLSPTSGTNWGTVTVSVNIAGLTAGTYNTTITITATGATNSPVSIPVTLIVNAPPIMTTLLAPNGGEEIPSGSIYAIQWSAPPEAVKFTLRYSINNGSTWKLIAKNVTGTSYDWIVPVQNNNKTNCLVKVIGFNASGTKVGEDISDSTFTIEVVKLTDPDGGETLTSGSTYAITWTTNGTIRTVAQVKLSYSTNGGSTWKAIKTLTGNPGSYNWAVPNVTSTTCKVKVVLKDSGGVTVGSDMSDGLFTIQP